MDTNRITDPKYAEVCEMERLTRRIPLQSITLDTVKDGIEIAGIPVADIALQRLSSMIGVPSRFYEKCSPFLTKQIFQEFLGKTERAIDMRAIEGQGALSFIWSDAVILPATGIVDAIAEALAPIQVRLTKVQYGLNEFTLFITDPDAFRVIGDDQIHFGVSVSSAFDGSTPTKVNFSFFRPICTNGAVITEASWSLPRRSYHEVEPALLAIGEGASNIFRPLLTGGYDEWKNNIRSMAMREIERPVEEIMHTTRRMGISPKVSDAVLEAFEAEPTATDWGIVNAFTRAANDVGEISLAEQLWASAGTIVHVGHVPCKLCGHVPGDAD